MKHIGLCAALLLGGCGMFDGMFSSGPQVAAPELTPEQQACRAEARRSPEVRAIWSQMAPDNNNRERVENDLRAAELRVFRRCLADRGVPNPGGVVSVRQ